MKKRKHRGPQRPDYGEPFFRGTHKTASCFGAGVCSAFNGGVKADIPGPPSQPSQFDSAVVAFRAFTAPGDAAKWYRTDIGEYGSTTTAEKTRSFI